MPKKWDPLDSAGAQAFGKEKDEAMDDSGDDDLELGLEQSYIYEVPKNIRQGNEKAYTPQLISIGPLHYRKKNLAKMAKNKVIYQQQFLRRTSEQTLKSFWSYIQLNEKVILDCYEALIDEDEFVRMIFYDALFILELFLRNYEKKKGKHLETRDLLLKGTWSVGLRRDLILLENQIPFFVLEELYKSYCSDKLDSDASALSFLRLACIYFDIPWDQKLEDMETLHFTSVQRWHLVRECHSNSNSDPSKIRPLKTMYSATILHEAGVELTAELDQKACLLDIKLAGKELKIPKLTVHSNTEAYIRNVMAFELCHCPVEAYVCAYIKLINYLIQSDKDVKLLKSKGVLSTEGKSEGNIVSRVSTDKMVVGMIKKLMQGVGEPPACYRETGNGLNQLYNDARKHKIAIYFKKNLAILKRVYFANLWRGTGTVAAFMVVVLTLIQTVLAFFK